MDTKATRQLRLKQLTSERGQKAQLAADAEVAPSQITQWINGGKKMSEEIARRIETVRNLPDGWMDNAEMALSNDPLAMDNHVYIQSFELWSGSVDKEIRFMFVPQGWLKAEGYDQAKCVSIEMPDSSQHGLVNQGYEIAVNTDWGTKPINNVYYAIRLGGVPTVRCIEYQYDDSVILKCLSPNHSDQAVPAADVKKLDIIGEAVLFVGKFPKATGPS